LLYFVQYRDKKVVGVFVRFRAPLHQDINILISSLLVCERPGGSGVCSFPGCFQELSLFFVGGRL
jgi:hypothetical protein